MNLKDKEIKFQEFLAESGIITSCPEDDNAIVAYFHKEMATTLEELKEDIEERKKRNQTSIDKITEKNEHAVHSNALGL